MKPTLMLLALCALCGSAIAQTSECRSIPKASDRLACYDKAAPPASRGKPAATSQIASPEPDQSALWSVGCRPVPTQAAESDQSRPSLTAGAPASQIERCGESGSRCGRVNFTGKVLACGSVVDSAILR